MTSFEGQSTPVTNAKRTYTSPRKRRQSNNIKNIILTNRDLSVLYMLSTLRFMTSTQILIYLNIDPESSTATKMRHRLRSLFDHNYIDRIADPKGRIEGGGSRPTIYALGDAGADLLTAPPYNVERGGVYWTAKNRNVTDSRFIHHTLQTSAFMINVMVACRVRGDLVVGDEDVILENATQFHKQSDTSLRGWKLPYLHDSQTDYARLVPDRMFYIEREEDHRRKYFYLEIDRGTMPVKTTKNRSSIQKKITLYHYSARHRLHLKHFCYEHFGTVLFVTTSDERVSNMIAVTQEVLGSRGWRRVLFTSQKAIDATIVSGGTLFDTQWRTGADGEMTTLLAG